MRARRSFAERSEIVANVTKLTPMQKELNDKLISAAENEDINNIKNLIEKGADVDVRNWLRRTALHYAASEGNVDVAKVLIENEADVDAKDDDGWTVLHWAAWNGNVDVARVLIEKGADVDAKNKDGETVQEIAKKYRQDYVVELIENAKKTDSRIYNKDIDILNMDMDELVRRADESAKRLCRSK